ncbi:interferon-inducible GTPase 5-like [Alosa pseudoharengus]|uniref:interferon-inducible GTPase 5-like n=1 Tax=Alosa pseudoharengus TaxID=34774 RepID=UPI003F8B3204
MDSLDGDDAANVYTDKCLDVEDDQYSLEGMCEGVDPYVGEVIYEEDHNSQHICEEEDDIYHDNNECSNGYTEPSCIYENFQEEFRQKIRNEDLSSAKIPPRGNTSATIAERVVQRVVHLDHVTLNIGVTGNTGAGKSSFVNAIRGLSNDDEGAAETGVTETTMEPTPFLHPTMPNVTIWDLPGIGTPKFKAKTYLSDVHFERYDFFIIVTSERFKENDINLAKAIKRKKKHFYFIRSKIDNDINAERQRRDFNKENVLSRIREDCTKNLKVVGNPQVFLISSFSLQEYDFTRLIDTLRRDLPEKKKQALIQSLPVYSIHALARKKKHFQKMISLQAFGSCAGAILPIPGLTLGVDYGIAKSFFSKVFRSFGLDENSLRRLASRVNMDQEYLKNALQSRFKDGITDEVLMSFLNTPAMASLMTMKMVLSALVVAGSLPAGIISVGMMRRILNKGLKEMAKDASAMLEAAILNQL